MVRITGISHSNRAQEDTSTRVVEMTEECSKMEAIIIISTSHLKAQEVIGSTVEVVVIRLRKDKGTFDLPSDHLKQNSQLAYTS